MDWNAMVSQLDAPWIYGQKQPCPDAIEKCFSLINQRLPKCENWTVFGEKRGQSFFPIKSAITGIGTGVGVDQKTQQMIGYLYSRGAILQERVECFHEFLRDCQSSDQTNINLLRDALDAANMTPIKQLVELYIEKWFGRWLGDDPNRIRYDGGGCVGQVEPFVRVCGIDFGN